MQEREEGLLQRVADLEGLLTDEKKKYERMIRERNMSNAAATEAEKGAMKQWGEVTARDEMIVKLREQHEKVTGDSIKKSTKIDELRQQRDSLKIKLREMTTLQTIVGERDSELGTLRSLIDIRNEDINGLEESMTQTREELLLARVERERLQLRFNELEQSLATVQEELDEALNQAGANRETTAAMARQIEMLIADQSLKRNELDSLRRQLEASTNSAREAQSRLRATIDRQHEASFLPASMISTPLTRPTTTPTSGVTTQFLPDPRGDNRGSIFESGRLTRGGDPLGAMYAGSSERSNRSMRSRDRDDFDEDRPQRSSGARRSRDRDDFDEDRPHRMSGFRRSRDEDISTLSRPRFNGC